MHKDSNAVFLRQSRLHWENTKEKFDLGLVDFQKGGGKKKKIYMCAHNVNVPGDVRNQNYRYFPFF